MYANTHPALLRFTAFLKGSCIIHHNNMRIPSEMPFLQKAKARWISRDLGVHLPSLASKASACFSSVPGVQGCELLGLRAGMLCPAGMEVCPGVPASTTQSREVPGTLAHSWSRGATFGLCLWRMVQGQPLGHPVTQAGETWQEGGN